MTYESIKAELKEQNLEIEFCSLFESIFEESFIIRISNSNKIHSTASLLRTLISKLEFRSKTYDYWVCILQFYMHPKFDRPESIQEWIKQNL